MSSNAKENVGINGAPEGVRSTFLNWAQVDMDGDFINTLGQGDAYDTCRRHGTADYITCPTGTINNSQQACHDANINSIRTTLEKLREGITDERAPKFLILYGSLRKDSCARMLAIETARILDKFGADVKLYDPKGLPLFCEDIDPNEDEKVKELRTLVHWSDGMVWVSPEYHSNFSGVFKNQVDWMPLSEGGIRPTQGKTLAVMQVEGGSQSFNTVNNLRVLGRWMRCVCIPNQMSIPKAQMHFDSEGKMVNSAFRNRLVDIAEELFKYTLLLRDQQKYLTTRYSESSEGKEAIRDAQAPKIQQGQPGAGFFVIRFIYCSFRFKNAAVNLLKDI
eukprot:Pgem_evm2s11358